VTLNDNLQKDFDRFIAVKLSNGEITASERDDLFKEFLQWRGQQTPSGSANGQPVTRRPLHRATKPTSTETLVDVPASVNIRSAPSTAGSVIGVLPKGAAVEVLETENGWLHVAGSDGVAIGWVDASFLK
jgi:hypothetical protein